MSEYTSRDFIEQQSFVFHRVLPKFSLISRKAISNPLGKDAQKTMGLDSQGRMSPRVLQRMFSK